MKQTVIQELIEMLKEARSVSNEEARSILNAKNSYELYDILENRMQTYTNAIRLAESLLEKEKWQILDAYRNGWLNFPDGTDGWEYYDKTFNQ
jgi:hypothetical protein